MSVVDALKNSPKGQLQYTRTIGITKLKRDLENLSPIPLTRSHKERESSKLNLSFGLDVTSFEESQGDERVNFNENSCILSNSGDRLVGKQSGQKSSRDNDSALPPHLHDDEPEKKDYNKDELAQDPSLQRPSTLQSTSSVEKQNQRKPPVSSCRASPVFGYSSKVILEEEESWESAFRLRMLDRLSQFDDHDRALKFLMKRKQDDSDTRLKLLNEHRQKQIERHMQEGIEANQKILQKLREIKAEHEQKIVTKNKEIQKKRVLLEEEEKNRQRIKAGKLKHLSEMFQEIQANHQQFGQLQDQFEHKGRLPENISRCRTVFEKTLTVLAAQVLQVQTEGSTNISLDELINICESHRDKSGGAIVYLAKEIADIEAKVKEEEEQRTETARKQEEEQKQRELNKKLEQEAAQDFGVQSLAYGLKQYKSKLQKLAEVETAIKSFIENPQVKKYRFDLLRAVNTPINAISGVSGQHLKDKLQRLYSLLSGQPVTVSSKPVCIRDSPDALLFCQNLVAKMLVRKGEEQVTSLHESAFAIGAVVVGLWSQFPVVGELFLGHLITLCPYVLPFHCPRQEGQSTADYHRSLGYKVDEDGTVEEQDKFLRRMSGLMRLYCSCVVATPPLRGPSSPHPHGLENAWSWLARTLNQEPQPDVTAAMIHDVLSVTGNALLMEYKVQFVKMIYELQKSYLPKLKNVSVTQATVGRLEIFLETTMKNHGRIPLPEGILTPYFWSSS